MTGHCFQGAISEAQGDPHSQSLRPLPSGFHSQEGDASGRVAATTGLKSLEVGPPRAQASRGQDLQAVWEVASLTRAAKALGPMGRTGCSA